MGIVCISDSSVTNLILTHSQQVASMTTLEDNIAAVIMGHHSIQLQSQN
jgi:hypothetical protein